MDRVVLWFLAAKASSDVGFALDFVCLAVFVWVGTESTLATGAVGACLYAGGIVGGRLVHRYGGGWDRRRAMVVADLARLGALALLAGLPGDAQLWWLFPTVVVIGLGRSVFEATLAAATPALAGGRVQRLNSLLTGVKGLALVLGMGLATLAVPAVGFRGVFALDAASYGLSACALLVLRLRMREGPVPAGSGRDVAAGVGDALSEITFRHSLQQLPDDRRGSAFGLSQVVINAGFVAGLVLTSVALVPGRLAGWVLLLHGIPLLAALASAFWLRRRERATAGGVPAGGALR
jgi:hypothetical protein